MIKNLKRYLKNLLKSDSNFFRYLAYFVVIIAVVLIVRFENKGRLEEEARAIEAEKQIELLKNSAKKKKFMFDSIMRVNEMIKIEADGVKVENNILRANQSKIDSIFARYNKHDLKGALSEYKRYRMSISR